MRVIPVIDLRKGVVVQALKGEREKYKPVKSVLTDSSDPIKVAEAFKEKFGFNELYIADLDSIEGRGANLQTIKLIKRMGFKVMVDFGIDSLKKCEQLVSEGVDQIIIGTETLTRKELVWEISSKIGLEKTILSIDLIKNKVKSDCDDLKKLTLTKLVREFEGHVSQFIFLKLDKVGTLSGPDVKEIKDAVLSTLRSSLFGGGVKSLKDIVSLSKAGFQGVLISTAFHKGLIKPEEIKSLNL